jgi:hypothetical protein
VVAVDPLHRPIYILHPSLVVRVYRGEGSRGVKVANLRRPAQPQLFAGTCSSQAPWFGRFTRPSRIAETGRPAPSY